MGLSKNDLKLVPEQMSPLDCYTRIYNWHKKHGKDRLKEVYKQENSYSKNYLRLLEKLPEPDKASSEDMDFIFSESLTMLMEWAYHEQDEYSIKMAAYAQFALNKKYGGFGTEEFYKSKKNSMLFNEFDHSK